MTELAYALSVEVQPAPRDVQTIQEGLAAYNRLYAPEDNYQPLTLFLRAPDQTLAGGLLGETYWGWLHLSVVWVQESIRRRGYGTQLLARAEQEAEHRGCRKVHLDTLSFQARAFYERHGYRVFGVLSDHPAGYSRYFLTKDLAHAETSAEATRPSMAGGVGP